MADDKAETAERRSVRYGRPHPDDGRPRKERKGIKMALSRTQKERFVNRWIEAEGATLFVSVDKLPTEESKACFTSEGYYVQTNHDANFCDDFESLFTLAYKENNEEVERLRRKGEDDYLISAYGYMLPEDIEKIAKLEEVALIERTYTGGGFYLYRGILKDGRQFFGSTEEHAEIVKKSVNVFALDWDDDLCYGVSDAVYAKCDPNEKDLWKPIYEGKQTTSEVDELWENAPEAVRREA